MIPSNPWKSYRRVATQTAPPGQLVLMLFEGAIRFLERSLTGFQLEDPVEHNQTISNNIIRSQDIIRELDNSLDLELGGELAATLRRLYDYMDRRLMESNLRKEESGIREVIGRLSVVRDAWAEMLQKQSENTPEESHTPELVSSLP